MARERDERTLKMMEHYVELHEQGLTPGQIAAKYRISTQVVYLYLQEIADKAGVSRDSLLKQPNAEHAPFVRQFEPVKPIDTKGFKEKFQAAVDAMAETKEMVGSSLREAERFQEEIERREKTWQSLG